MSRISIAAVTILFLISSAPNSKAGDPKLLEADPLKQNEGVLSGNSDLGLMAPEPLAADEAIYQKGKFFLNAGVHLGNYRYGYGARFSSLRPMIPISASLEVGVFDFIGIGGYFGFARRSYEYEYSDWSSSQGYHTDIYEHRYTYTSIGAKASFHVIPFLNKTFSFDHNLDGSKYDLYIAHYLGTRIETAKWTDDVDDEVRENVDTDRDVDIVFFNPVIGARYMFTNFFGSFAEVGYGHFGGSELKIGLSLRM